MDYYNQPKEFEERIVQTKRVSKKTKGGNKIGFTALVVVGNKKGKVGVGLGKAPNIASAIQKGIKVAKKNIVDVYIKDESIPHEVTAKYKASIIKMMPAPEGSGVIAGGAVRDVVELAGIKNISAKLIGSNNKNCSVRCTVSALQQLKRS
jgi:small subunit ribosomal protein S5